MVRTSLNNLMAELAAGIELLIKQARLNIDSLSPLLNGSETDVVSLSADIVSRDKFIRKQGDELEGLIVKILSLQAPVGRDLRKVISSFRIIYDLERISRDSLHAFEFFDSSRDKQNDFPQSIFSDVLQTLNALRGIMDNFSSVYFSDDFVATQVTELAQNTSNLDEQIDKLFEQEISEIHAGANAGKLNAESAHLLLFALRAYERVGDHACNLLERAVYVQTGEKIRVE